MRSHPVGLHWIDGVIIAAYACGMIVFGFCYTRRQRSTSEFFTGGGAMNPLLIGISLFATLFSTISYLTSPGEVLRHGPVVPLIGILTIPFYYYLVGHLMRPSTCAIAGPVPTPCWKPNSVSVPA